MKLLKRKHRCLETEKPAAVLFQRQVFAIWESEAGELWKWGKVVSRMQVYRIVSRSASNWEMLSIS